MYLHSDPLGSGPLDFTHIIFPLLFGYSGGGFVVLGVEMGSELNIRNSALDKVRLFPNLKGIWNVVTGPMGAPPDRAE